jgi:hypothetical protein
MLLKEEESPKNDTLKSKKDKSIPLQAWAGPEGSRSVKIPDFKIIGTRRW